MSSARLRQERQSILLVEQDLPLALDLVDYVTSSAGGASCGMEARKP